MTTYGFGKPYILPLTTPELWKLEREFQIPKTQTESLVARGLEADLFDREFISPEEEIEDLKEEIEKNEEMIGGLEEDVAMLKADLVEEAAKYKEMEEVKAGVEGKLIKILGKIPL